MLHYFALAMITTFRNTSRLSAALLLAVFSFVMVPREVWHTCQRTRHHYLSHHSDGQQALQNSDACPICDFQLLPYIFSADEVALFKPVVYIDQSQELTQAYHAQLLFETPSRAPPAVV